MKYRITGNPIREGGAPLGNARTEVDDFTLAQMIRDYYLAQFSGMIARFRTVLAYLRATALIAMVGILGMTFIFGAGPGSLQAPKIGTGLGYLVTAVVAIFTLTAVVILFVGIPLLWVQLRRARQCHVDLVRIEEGAAVRSPLIRVIMKDFVKRGVVEEVR